MKISIDKFPRHKGFLFFVRSFISQQQQQQQQGRKKMKKKYQAKFPMARIKKIMQKDEEVGKIAVSTPIVMCKFMIYWSFNFLSQQ